LGPAAALLVRAAMLRLAELEGGEPVAPGARERRLRVGALAAIGLPLALAAFWLFPRMATPLWGVPERAISRTGLSDSMRPGDWIDMLVDDSPALRVSFDGATPPTSEMYWRGPALWDYDGREWTTSRWLGALPAADVRHGPARYRYEMEVEPTEGRMLVALELPTELPDGVRAGYGHTLATPRPLTAVTRWRMSAAAPVAFETDLRAVARQAALRLPDGFNPRTVA